jgi:hypothetical protein
MGKWQCTDWAAWHNKMPDAEPTIFVLGRCVMPTPGYKLVLTRRDPGPVEEDLQLELRAKAPEDIVPPIVWPADA